MTTPAIIVILEEDLAKGWTWLQNEARVVWTGLSDAVSHAWAAVEPSIVQRLWSAGAALVTKLAQAIVGGVSLADLETAFLNIIQTLGSDLLGYAQKLGSLALQGVLGVLQAKAVQAVTAA